MQCLGAAFLGAAAGSILTAAIYILAIPDREWQPAQICERCDGAMQRVGSLETMGKSISTFNAERWVCTNCGYVGYKATSEFYQKEIGDEYQHHRPGAARRVLTLHGWRWQTNEEVGER